MSQIKKYTLTFLALLLIVIGCRQKSYDQPEKRTGVSREQLIMANRALVRKDRERIMAFIDSCAMEMTETSTGLWYNIDEEGKGPEATEGNTVKLTYAVKLLDGTLCYSSVTDGIKSFKVGKGGVESGLEEGILLLRNGSRAQFIMPPHLAYGLPGDGNKIPPRAILYYTVEVLSIE